MSQIMLQADSGGPDVTRQITTRLTKGGRKLHYELTVLQQPERARACGSGQKSAADRRPVDPPPVVQLRILEGTTPEDAKDITFNYNANFFVFADLANARPMAHGRVQTAAATSPPVLTGVPVSGMAYLDRPAEAGYFLFPDLSVRHEGRYVLGFTLYEEIKEEQDEDAELDDKTNGPDANVEPGFWLRMKVTSAPFVVFSAKKFPGLTSSTALGRAVAEQGCRVRIRRDVRMRRRDGKPPASDYDKADEDMARSRRTQTPDIRSDPYRPRSTSNSSEQRTPYAPAPERRTSGVDSYPPPPPGYNAQTPTLHARYGSDGSNAGYASHQYIQPVAQPPPISPTSAYPPGSHAAYPGGPAPPPPPGYNYQSRPTSQQYAAGPPSTPAHDAYPRRPSNVSVPPSPSTYGPREMDYRRESDFAREPEYKPDSDYSRGPEIKSGPPAYPLAPIQAKPPTTGPVKLPPIENVSKARSNTLPGPSSITSYRNDYIEPAPPASLVPVAETVRAGSKRGYVQTFSENTKPLYVRPTAARSPPRSVELVSNHGRRVGHVVYASGRLARI